MPNAPFNYTYSAKDQSEIQRIRQKYLPKEPGTLELLRRMDARVSQKAMITSLTVGILGALVLGTGMSCAMVFRGMWFIPGILIGLAGMALCALAYPVYKNTLEKERERIAPEVLRLTEELMK